MKSLVEQNSLIISQGSFTQQINLTDSINQPLNQTLKYQSTMEIPSVKVPATNHQSPAIGQTVSQWGLISLGMGDILWTGWLTDKTKKYTREKSFKTLSNHLNVVARKHSSNNKFYILSISSKCDIIFLSWILCVFKVYYFSLFVL